MNFRYVILDVTLKWSLYFRYYDSKQTLRVEARCQKWREVDSRFPPSCSLAAPLDVLEDEIKVLSGFRAGAESGGNRLSPATFPTQRAIVLWKLPRIQNHHLMR